MVGISNCVGLSPVELADWQRLVAMFPSLSDGDDEVFWTLSTSGKFSVKSLYGAMVGGHRSSNFSLAWKAIVPPKIKVFLW